MTEPAPPTLAEFISQHLKEQASKNSLDAQPTGDATKDKLAQAAAHAAQASRHPSRDTKKK